MSNTRVYHYTAGEEFAHAATHGLGALLSLGALVWMLDVSIAGADPWRIVASIVYGLSLITLFTASTLYHSLHKSAHRHFLKIMDHCAIYLLIAGTATPFLLIAMQGEIRWWLFGAMWTLAAIGISTKLSLGHSHPRLSLISYLLMGWLMVVAIPELTDAIGDNGIRWLVAGGLSYTIGALFYIAKSRKFSHAVWHLFVLGGSACHFVPVILYVLPPGA